MKYSTEFKNLFNKNSKITLEQFDSKFYSDVINFFPDKYKNTVKNKLDNLSVNIKLNGSSTYDYFDNTVYILQQNILDYESFVHEVFHAISTNKKEDKTIIGLRKIIHSSLLENKTETIFGTAINEGSNTFFTARFLSKILNNNYEIKVASFYRFCTNIFANLTNLIGENKSKELHFFGGFDEFVNEINKSCYRKTDSKIIKLVANLDSFFGVSTVNRWIGVDYSTDARILLTDTYKALVDLFVFKCEKEKLTLNFDILISNEFLNEDDKTYFKQYIFDELKQHYENRIKQSYKNMIKNKIHIDYDTMEKYSQILILKAMLGKEIKGDILPEKLKCGEFYNFVLISCAFIDENFEREGIKTNDVQRLLTVAFFDENNNFMPKDDNKMVNTLKQLLASKIAVRAGIEVSDELVIKALNKDSKFNIYLIDSNPDYYTEIYSKINDEMKYNYDVLKKSLKDVFVTNLQRYKLKKSMPDKYKTDDILELFEQEKKNEN